MRLPHRLALLFLVVSTATSCFAQTGVVPPKKMLQGYVRDEATQRGIQSARIDLQGFTGTTFGTVYSGIDGEFHYDGIGDREFRLLVAQDGYLPARVDVASSMGISIVYKIVFLRRVSPASTAADTPSDPISAHQLSVAPKARSAFEKGVALLNSKSDLRGAVAQFQRAISVYPSYYEAYDAMGVAEFRLGDAAAAEAALRESIELSAEKYPDAMIDLGAMLDDLKRFAEAEPFLRRGIALDESSWRGHTELARAFLGLRRLTEAEGDATKARDLKPDNPEVYLVLTNIHLGTHDHAAVLRDADAFLNLVPTGPTSDQVRKIRAQAEKAIEATPPQSSQQPQ